MLKNYIKIAFRNLTGNKGYTFLNLTGLVVGMAGAILILLWVKGEMSVDRFYENGDRIYKVWNQTQIDNEIWSWHSTPKVMGPVLENTYPEIKTAVRFDEFTEIVLATETEKFSKRVAFVDSTFLEMFSLSLISGDKSTVLDGPNNIVLTKSLAMSLFGNIEVIGERVRIQNKEDATVAGIMEDLPNNTQFDFSALLTWRLLENLDYSDNYWGNNSIGTFVEVHESINIADLNAKVKTITREHSDEEVDVFLYPLEEMYLRSEFKNGVPVGGNIDLVYMFIAISAIILLIACINFMNLSTARSERRAKEVGVRKLSGAKREWLVAQFMIESVILALFAGVLALSLVQLVLPYFNNVMNTHLVLPYGNALFWVTLLGFIVFTGVLAGSYPALFLSSFLPVRALKGALAKKANSMFAPRKILVVLQFTFAIMLIASTLIMRQQIGFVQDREQGYDQENLIFHNLNENIEKNYESFRTELLSNPEVLSITKTMSPITQIWSNTWGIGWPGKDPESTIIIDRYATDSDLVKTMGMTLIKGRDIDVRKYATDSMAVLLNEAAVRVMDFDEPLGNVITDGDDKYTVVGVVKDYVTISPYIKTGPLVILGPSAWFSTFHVKLNDNLKEGLALVEAVFNKYYPNQPFEYNFVDESYQKRFAIQQRVSILTSLFSALAIFISCLGLFGLSAFAAEKRIKEIGVRKVLGAPVSNILWLLSTDFLKLVLISVLIGVPVAWYAMNQYLGLFEYKITITAGVFILTSILCLIVALVTVLSQALRAAYMNPVKSLRYE